MEVCQGPNWGCSAKTKNKYLCITLIVFHYGRTIVFSVYPALTVASNKRTHCNNIITFKFRTNLRVLI
jgi:hypothetical protein